MKETPAVGAGDSARSLKHRDAKSVATGSLERLPYNARQNSNLLFVFA
jgi:hypothetical protein